jgi:MerR family transcriptional regulator, redox-sensitive transcriptional activator SoxR
MKRSDVLSIGQLSSRTGVAVSAIRYYETQSLIASVRNSGGQRRFLRADIRRLSFIMIAQQFGFSLERIADLLGKLPQGRTPNKADWSRISKIFKTELDERIATLSKLRDNLDGCIGCGCLSLEKCKLYNPDDRAGIKGKGPRYLMGDSPETTSGTEQK